jgi:pre-mRNA-processing factor 6
MKIPEPLDYTRRNRLLKKDREKQYDRLSAAPDSLIASMIASAQPAATVEESGAATPAHDLAQLGRAREEVIRVRLDRKMDSVTGTTNINPESYMSHLNAVRAASLVETGDIDRSRTLLTSIRETNPNYPPGWIGAARLEAEAGKLVRARQIILEACEKCPTSEDVWLEAARLHTPQNAATILARAVRAIPQSVNIWLAARDLEQKPEARRAVLRRALDLMPFSERLWKAAVEEEEPEDARVLLTRAVECVPQSVDLWLALAKLETYQNAKKVLNSARKALPAEPLVWITAAKLEEANGNVEHVKTIIRHAVKSMQQQSVVIPRDTWLKHAEMAEQTGSRHTCHAIVRTAIGLGVEQQDHRNAWLHDAEQFIVRGSFECARNVRAARGGVPHQGQYLAPLCQT